MKTFATLACLLFVKAGFAQQSPVKKSDSPENADNTPTLKDHSNVLDMPARNGKTLLSTQTNSISSMADDWTILPPCTNEQGPTDVSPGSLIRDDFDIVKHTSEFDMLTSLRWAGLSRQEVANLRNLTRSKELEDFLRPYNCGISSGIEVNMASGEDPRDAEFGLMISAEQEMPQIVIHKIVDFVKQYRVH